MLEPMGRRMRIATVAGLLVLGLALAAPSGGAAESGGWTGTWGASPVYPVGPVVNRQTVRQTVRISIGGDAVRLRFTNETGTEPMVIGPVSLARPGGPGAIDKASAMPVTFGGAAVATIPPGAPLLSDPVPLAVQPLEVLSISAYVPRWTGPSVIHLDGVATAYVSAAGEEQTAAETLTSPTTTTYRYFLSGVEVQGGGEARPAIVALGDSITDGNTSIPDANHRWPDHLAERLHAAGRPMGVVNAGVSGNRVLNDLPEAQFGPSALARFDRDVASVPGAAFLVVMEGINDIGHSTQAGLAEQAVTPEQIIAGHKQLIARAKAKGMKVFGATLTPYEGTTFPGYYTEEGEAKRQAVNAWIRTGGAYDAVIDFDAVVRDPANPKRIKAELDSGDHLHPNDAGYKAMAEAVDLELFR